MPTFPINNPPVGDGQRGVAIFSHLYTILALTAYPINLSISYLMKLPE